jgi:hypothetical protein
MGHIIIIVGLKKHQLTLSGVKATMLIQAYHGWVIFDDVPPKQLTSIVLYTNSELELLNKQKTSKSEILRFFWLHHLMHQI